MTKKLLMGNEAMAYAALEAGVRVAAGYPGTPSSEIIETIARLHASGAAQGVHVEWSANEKAALELLGGASLAGARCLFTCKQMGLNVASDPLMCLNYVGIRGGLVLIVADDPGPISSQTEQDTRRFAAFAKVPVLDPATPEQAYEMVKAAFDLSERFGTPVIVRPTTRVDHASAFFDVPDQTQALPVPEGGFERDPARWVIFPRRSYEAHAAINERLPQMTRLFSAEEPWAAFNGIVEEEAMIPEGYEPDVSESEPVQARRSGGRHAASRAGTAPAFAYGIVAGGISASYAREALRMLAERAESAGVPLPAYRFMQVGTPYPFPTQAFWRFAEGLSDILVFEELDYVLEDEMLQFAGVTHAPYAVHGKRTGDVRDRGENDVDDIMARIAAFFGVSTLCQTDDSDGAISYSGELPVRPPVLCPGCPHRGSFYAVKKAVADQPAVLCGDIGCYTLGNAKPLEAVDTCLCMGAGITMAQGIAVADPGKKAVAFVGDSTFFASGMPGLANAAYNGHDITVVVLDNATTAMTGSQPHPGTGVTLMGEQRTPISVEAVLRANGFTHIYRANPLDKDAALVAAKAAIAYNGPSAVVFESPCVQLIKPGTPLVVDTATCIGCKKCINEIGCPAISFDATAEGPKSGTRGQALIDPSQCNGCGLCAQICPTRAIAPVGAGPSAVGAAVVGAVEAAAAAETAQSEVPPIPAILNQVGDYRAADQEESEESAEPKLEVQAEAEVEPEPDADRENELELEVEPELEVESEFEAEAEAESETDREAETEQETEPEDEIEEEPEDKPEAESAFELMDGQEEEAEPDDRAEPKEAEPEDEIEAEYEIGPEPESEDEAESEPAPESEEEFELESSDGADEDAYDNGLEDPDSYYQVEFPDDVEYPKEPEPESAEDAFDEPTEEAETELKSEIELEDAFDEEIELEDVFDEETELDLESDSEPEDESESEDEPFEDEDYFVEINMPSSGNPQTGQDWYAWKKGYPHA